MLCLHNILNILNTFSKHRQILFLILFYVDHIFHCFKDLCNWVSTALIITGNLFYCLKYTNCWFLISISKYFLACNLFFHPSVHCPKTSAYYLCIFSSFFVFCRNQLLIFSLKIISITEPFNGMEYGVLV